MFEDQYDYQQQQEEEKRILEEDFYQENFRQYVRFVRAWDKWLKEQENGCDG